jgi:hypothetical protein
MNYDASGAEIASLRDYCLSIGLVEGADFHITGYPAPLSSEHVELRRDSHGCRVSYVDMGRRRTLAEGATPASVRDVFIDECTWLAAGRGRGPRAGRERPIVVWGAGLTDEEYLKEFNRRHGITDGDDAPRDIV